MKQDFGKFEKLHVLGEGAYGKVYKIKQKNRLYSLKKTKNYQMNQGIPQSTFRELVNLRQLNHKNIVKLVYYQWNLEKQQIYIIQEYLDYDLSVFIRKKFLSEKQIKYIFRQIVEGVQYCHENFIFHRDLKPSNILINENLTTKLTDFGLSKKFSIPFKEHTQEIQTLFYRAPEVLLGDNEYGVGVDLWPLGLILYEMFAKECFFRYQKSELGVLIKIFEIFGTPNTQNWKKFPKLKFYSQKFPKFKNPKIEEKLKKIKNPLAKDLIKKLLMINPLKRLSCRQILLHPFLNKN